MNYFNRTRPGPLTPRRLITGLGAGTLAIGWATASLSSARAADAPPPTPDAIEEVVVTATKRQEPLQKVPVAITVIDGEHASQQNLNTLNTLSTQVPSLDFRDGASNKDQALFIRGMGTVTTSPGAEPSVSTVVDGVPLDRPGQATFDLFDIDRIEVLRGPQGTLFGKNASAGAINIVTRQPTDAFHAYADLSYFTGGDEKRAEAGISGPLAPGKANGLLSVLTSDYDGNVTNVYNDDKVNGYTHNGGRAKLELTPTDSLRALLSIDYLQSHDTVPTGVLANTTVAYPGGVTTANPALAKLVVPVVAGSDNLQVTNNTNTHVDDKNGGISSQLDWSLGDYTVTSISAYRRWNNDQVQDFDGASSSLVKQIQDNGHLDFYQGSEELRVASPKGHFLDYVAGVYYLHAVDDEVYQRTDTALAGTVNSGRAAYGTTNNNYSAFGEATLNFTDSFRGIAGVRVVREDLSYYHSRQSTAADTGINPSSPYTTGNTADLNYSDRFGLQYDLSKEATAYATYSRGYKGPAYNVFFNMVPSTQGAPLAPETSDSYEIGLKAKGFEDRARLDLALFHTRFENYQANFPNLVNGAVVTNLVNAGTVSSQGAEVDLTLRPIQRLTLTGNLAITDAHIDSVDDITPKNWPLAGKALPFTPTWKANIRGDYRIPLTDRFEVALGTNYRWQSEVQYDLGESPDTIQPAFGIWDADISLIDIDGSWRLSVLAKNLLDTHYSSYLQSSAVSSAPGTPGYVTRWVPRDDGRYFGVSLRKEF